MAFVWTTCCVIVLPTVAAGEAEQYLGPSALAVAKDGETLFVAHADAKQLAWVELPSGKIVRRVDLPSEPTGVVLHPDETTLIVTCAAPKSTVLMIDAVSGHVTPWHRPFGPGVHAGKIGRPRGRGG